MKQYENPQMICIAMDRQDVLTASDSRPTSYDRLTDGGENGMGKISHTW